MSQRQDWANVLTLANTILNWGIGVPQDVYKAAQDAKVAANSRGFESPLIFTNVRDLIVCKNNQASVINQAFTMGPAPNGSQFSTAPNMMGLSPNGSQFVIPPQNVVQTQVCKQDQIIRGVEEHMLNLVHRQDWEALLLLSNSILLWSPDVSRDLYEAAKLAVASCNQRGVTTDNVYANLQEIAEHGSVIDLRKRLDSIKKVEKVQMNEELKQYRTNAKTMSQTLTDPDLKKEFEEHFFLKGESHEALKRAQGSSFGISNMAIGIQERNAQRVEEELLVAIEKDPLNAHEQLGMSRRLYDALLLVYGSTALFINKYVRSRPIMFFVGILLLKFVLVYLCRALGGTISSVASAFGTSYVVGAFTLALPIVLFGALLTSLTFGMRGARAQLMSLQGVVGGIGSAGITLGFLTWANTWLLMPGIVYEIAQLVKSAVVFIYKNGLTTEGVSACSTTYTDFNKDVVFPGIRTMFTWIINGICEAITHMGMGGLATSMDLCGVFRAILEYLPGIVSPDVSFAQMSEPFSNVPMSPEAQVGIVNNVFSIFSSGYWKQFNFQKWPDFADFWTSMLQWPSFSALLQYRHNLFLSNPNMKPDDVVKLMMSQLAGVGGAMTLVK